MILFLRARVNKMLVEFRIKNYRSLRDEQVLSLVAAKDKTLQDTHTVATDLKAVPSLLKSAAIYGANASGKSNLIKGLQKMRELILESATHIQPGQKIAIQPFRLDDKSAIEPTEFEVTFILDNVRYQYGFATTAERIVSEHLLVYKAFKPQKWFERYWDPKSGKDEYEFGAGLKGSKTLWESATRPNALFLSMAVQLNSDLLRPVYNWFDKRLVIFNEHAKPNPTASIQLIKQAEGHNQIRGFLAAADISISDVQVNTTSRTTVGSLTRNQVGLTKEVDELRFHHTTKRGKAIFDLMDESNGTRNLLFLSGPVLKILGEGLTLVIDELDTSLHTLLVRELVNLFHQVNTSNAQLIFTTHDASLLDAPGLFRRDQIWFVEKDQDQASSLIALSEFSPRKNEALERGYLMGRYGGVPFLNPNLGIKP